MDKSETMKTKTPSFNGELKKNTQAEELLVRTPVKDTPFTIISNKETKEHFAVLGKYRITEKRKSLAELKDDIHSITWNRIIQVIMIIQNEFNNKNEELQSIIKTTKE